MSAGGTKPFVVPALPEGQPSTKPADEDAAHFLVRMVHKYPHEVTIYEGGPMTNLALAISLDPQFARAGAGTGLYGRKPESADQRPGVRKQSASRIQFLVRSGSRAHRAAGAVEEDHMHAGGHLDQDAAYAGRWSSASMRAEPPLAHYIARFYQPGDGNDYMWDELAAAAWLDPSVITQAGDSLLERGHRPRRRIRQHADLGPNATSQNVGQPVTIQMDLDKEKFYEMFVSLMSAPTPGVAH